MKFSRLAISLMAAQDVGMIKTNNDFWKNFSDVDFFESAFNKNENALNRFEILQQELDSSEDSIGIVCIFDDDFPVISSKVKNNSEKPYLLFYRGDLSLLSDLNRNVAVIGVTEPEIETIAREKVIVKQLAERQQIIVSGLAKGCDTVAHEVTLEVGAKTVAILPSSLMNIYPAENRNLAKNIVEYGGLLITEYYQEPKNKYDAIQRFINRDRLQSMFSKAIILISSYRNGEGDSGSRHAMEAAEKYDIERYIMYNEITDSNNPLFGLNKDYARGVSAEGKPLKKPINILYPKSITQIIHLTNPNFSIKEQKSLF